MSCDDACVVVWQLYDPAARRLLDAPWASGFDHGWIAPDGTAFVADGVVVRFDGGPLAQTPLTADADLRGGGWLGGGVPITP